MRDEAEVSAAAGSMVDRGVSQRSAQEKEDVKAELEATRVELDRALDTIENMTRTLAFLRSHPR